MEEKELIKLIDKYIDEALTIEETEEFNDLLECSKDFRDLFRQRIRLHGDLSNHYDAADVPGITPFKVEPNKKFRPVYYFLFTAVAALLALNIFIKNPVPENNREIVAQISYKDQIELLRENELISNDYLNTGKYKLKAGMVELLMPNDVVVAIEAPAIFEIASSKRINLDSGKLSADVGEAGRGFEVMTPDSKVIDLGTKFGVWVSSEGATEAHVFEGEINVISENKSIFVKENQSIKVRNGKEVSDNSANSSIFPMPSQQLDAGLVDGSFENKKKVEDFWPKSPAYWGGDHSEVVSAFENIKPYSGNQMLRFLKPHLLGEENTGQNSCQVWQIIDLKEHREHVMHGGAVAKLEAYVNRADSPNDKMDFIVSLLAFNGSMKDVKDYWNRKNYPLSELISQSSSRFHADNDESSWEEVNCQLKIPQGADFLLVQISAQDFSNVKSFGGQFIDDIKISFEVSPRKSSPIAHFQGQGSFVKKQNWRNEHKPDFTRERIDISGGDAVIDSSVNLKQTLMIATGNGSKASLTIGEKGVLNISRNGELIVGFNPIAEATLTIKGVLQTAGKSFIGRNNSFTKVVIDGGQWKSLKNVRMSQYNRPGAETNSYLEIINGGSFEAARFEIINDISSVKVYEGLLKSSVLIIGGDNGKAHLIQYGGRVEVERLVFGSSESIYEFSGAGAELIIKGDLKPEQLLAIKGATWLVNGKPAEKENFYVSKETVRGEVWTNFKLK